MLGRSVLTAHVQAVNGGAQADVGAFLACRDATQHFLIRRGVRHGSSFRRVVSFN